MLIEYIEVIIPLIYGKRFSRYIYCFIRIFAEPHELAPAVAGIYITTVCHLSNCVYYPQLVRLELAKSIANLALYTSLELCSFATIIWILRRKIGIAPLSQLAFVLKQAADHGAVQSGALGLSTSLVGYAIGICVCLCV